MLRPRGARAARVGGQAGQERKMVSAAEQLAANLNFSALAKAQDMQRGPAHVQPAEHYDVSGNCAYASFVTYFVGNG